ncbi:MAG: radical SAM protein [Deltaproteobacteria bacterium]|nr:radical SAM protein [Deltaproteobacteria bacterium]
MGLLRTDALNLVARRLKGQGLFGTARRYLRQARYRRAGLPIYLMIEPASVCNLRCPYCSVLQTSKRVPSGIMNLDDYKTLIDSILSRPGYYPPLDLFYRGEPLINPHFAEMAAYAGERGLSVGTSTNATLLSAKVGQAILDSGLEVMIVSFDGADKASYEAHRVGAVFEEVVEGLRAFIAERNRRGLKKPMVDLQFIVTRKNQDQIEAIRKLGAEMGVDHLSLKSMRVPLMDRPPEEALALGREFLPDDPAFRRYREVRGADGALAGYEPVNPSQTCNWGLASAIRFNGDIGLCCQDYLDTVDVGNVFEQDFWEVWWSQPYLNLRRAAYRRRPAICQTCD